MILDKGVVGDTLDFTVSDSDHPATDGWTLKYRLTPQFATPTQSPITLTATTYQTTDYRVLVLPAVTALWAAGIYTWSQWVEKTDDRKTLGEGRIEFFPDPSAVAQGYDFRTTAETAFEDAQTALANFQATGGRVKAYTIGSRSMQFDDASEILVLVKYWENEVAKERAAKAKQAGRPDTRRYFVRLNNA